MYSYPVFLHRPFHSVLPSTMYVGRPTEEASHMLPSSAPQSEAAHDALQHAHAPGQALAPFSARSRRIVASPVYALPNNLLMRSFSSVRQRMYPKKAKTPKDNPRLLFNGDVFRGRWHIKVTCRCQLLMNTTNLGTNRRGWLRTDLLRVRPEAQRERRAEG